MTKWIKNTGEHPVGLGNEARVQTYWSDGDIDTHDAEDICWEIDEDVSCTHWRRASNLTLDDAYDRPPKEENTMYKMPFDASVTSYPETTYEPLSVQPSQSSLIASIFNTLYHEPCALREVHVEALKAIMKLVEERGGE